jgi:hypothetical protein
VMSALTSEVGSVATPPLDAELDVDPPPDPLEPPPPQAERKIVRLSAAAEPRYCLRMTGSLTRLERRRA